jgi:FAD/FMN-containing dehydrogenase
VHPLLDRTTVLRDITLHGTEPTTPLHRRTATPGLAYGMGRSYGDVCLNPGGNLWATQGLNRFIAFDERTGLLRCEAGVLLRDIQRLALPRGWRLAVTPGSQLVTVGGAIANDVHGKNHHLHGSFGHHVRSLQLARTDGRLIECGPQQESDWFAATLGGLGLTGVIVTAELQLVPASGTWLETETLDFTGLEVFLALSDASGAEWEHSVAWLDTNARGKVSGLFMRGRPVRLERRPTGPQSNKQIPWVPPFSLVNRASLWAFNAAYRNFTKRGASIQQQEAFLQPLDHVQDWNRLYGPNGFYQYQCVVPRAAASDVLPAVLSEVTASGQGSFLNVLKTFGERPSLGMLSFVRPGVTLAIDFPNRGATTLQLLSRLDELVAKANGCLYPAKDARMPRALFELGFPRHRGFAAYRDAGISSALSRRLLGS